MRRVLSEAKTVRENATLRQGTLGRSVKVASDRCACRLALADQERVPTGGSFRATEKSSLPRFHRAVAQLAERHSHC